MLTSHDIMTGTARIDDILAEHGHRTAYCGANDRKTLNLLRAQGHLFFSAFGEYGRSHIASYEDPNAAFKHLIPGSDVVEVHATCRGYGFAECRIA